MSKIGQNKTQKYVKKDQLSHILDRPDMYVGSTRSRPVEEFVYENDRIAKKVIDISPAIIRVFIEPLSNAVDNVARSKANKNNVTEIKINIENNGTTTFWNDGDVVPIEMHEEEKCYNHTLIFGHLLTSSNYDDTEDREDISGKNGLGIKAVSVFSKTFKVEGVDPKNKKKFIQTWYDNMKRNDNPKITTCLEKKGYTLVQYTPDFIRFGIEGYSSDIISHYKKLAIDAAMITGVKVYFNDELLPVKNITEYARLYDENKETPILNIKTEDCNIVLTQSDEKRPKFQAISFANGICTPLGGTHVDAWTEGLFRPLLAKINKKGKPQLNIGDIKQFFRLFIVATVKKPEFDSQSKTKLEGPVVKSEVKKTHILAISKWPIMEHIEDIIRTKELGVLKKIERKNKKFTKIEGFDPANNEGGPKSSECTLILVEGLSAKTYATYGINIGAFGKQGKDWFGIYALRGKVLNCRNATPASIAKNTVISDIIKALGLKMDVDYTNDKEYQKLRYGKVMITTDSDSVTGDTPLLLRDENKQIQIKTIDSLTEIWININGKEYGNSNLEVWSDRGWTKIKSVMRHKTCKRIFRVVTHTGCVDVTEDHSLLTSEGGEISPVNLKIDNELLHNFPIFDHQSELNQKQEIPNLDNLSVLEVRKYAKQFKIPYYQAKTKQKLIECIKNAYNQQIYADLCITDSVDIDEAYVMGLFFSDGSSGIYNWKYVKKPINRPNTYTFNRVSYSWAIANTNLIFLEKSKIILNRLYPQYRFSIIPDRYSLKRGNTLCYKLIILGGKKSADFVKYYTNLLYDDKRRKIVPFIIHNSSNPIKESFFKGMYDGDGDRAGLAKHGTRRIDVCEKTSAMGVFLLCRSLGYLVSVNQRADKPKVYSLVLTKGNQNNCNRVKKIRDLGKQNCYVYDLETENHHFHAGVGQMIVHNTDGIHISGLIQNMIHALFPTLLQREESFITCMQTLIVRVYLNKTHTKSLLFYDENEYKKYVERFHKKFPDKKIDKKYYKGLGTNDEEDIDETFGKKLIKFKLDDRTFDAMNKAFHKKNADMRKNWLENYDPANIVLKWKGNEPEETDLYISDFIDGELIKFSHDDCKRSIPSLMDGLKEGHRKVLYTTFLRKLKYTGKVLKVAQLAGSVAEKTNYHHGEQNLLSTITNMASAYVGSNNIPLLFRSGQFGSRLEGGKDAANGRYIFTKLDALTRLIFREEDDVLLKKREDDGDIIEPYFYVPIIPMILVNGNICGIGTGWSSNVPCYNPLDLVTSIKIWLENDGNVLQENIDEETKSKITISLLPEIIPWYRGYKGEIQKTEDSTKYISWGNIEKKGTKFVINELPIGVWTNRYKEQLETWLEEGQLKKVENYSDPKNVNFVITESQDGFSCSLENLKLYSSIRTTNMCLITENEKLKKFNSTDEIIDSFCKVRYDYYIKRKIYQLEELEHRIKFLNNKKRFLTEVRDGIIILFDEKEGKKESRKTSEIYEELERKGYDKMSNFRDNPENQENQENQDLENEEKGSYDYLLRLQIKNITAEKINLLQKEIDKYIFERDDLSKTTEKEMWVRDLDEFVNAYTSWLDQISKEKLVKTKKSNKSNWII